MMTGNLMISKLIRFSSTPTDSRLINYKAHITSCQCKQGNYLFNKNYVESIFLSLSDLVNLKISNKGEIVCMRLARLSNNLFIYVSKIIIIVIIFLFVKMFHTYISLII